MREENRKQITALRHELHRHAELSHEERGTRQILTDFLRENTDLEVVECGEWFYARKRSGSRRAPIAFRADFDALPIPETIDLPWGSCTAGVSHKCGHDGHSAALCGLALELTGREVERDVFLVFQSAEEIGEGAALCAPLIAREGISCIYSFHNLPGYPQGTLIYRRGLTQPASEGLRVELRGLRSHAADPEKGRNPAAALSLLTLDALSLAARRPWRAGEGTRGDLPMLLCTVVGLSAGEGDFGVSAGEGSLSLTLRAEEEREMRALEEAILARAGELAAREHLKLTHTISDPFPATVNDDAALDRVLSAAGRIGLSCRPMEKLWRASEDFGVYGKYCPSAMVYLGAGEAYPALHTAGYDFNDQLLEPAVDLFAELALGRE